MRMISFSLCFLLALAGRVQAQDLPEIRIAVLKIGTVNWELTTLRENGLDRKHGFQLTVHSYADNGATRIAVQGDEADMAVADWIWVARQRAAGRPYVFIPYSKAVGGVVVPANSTAVSLRDLAGGEIGIAGGPLDKSWLILRAYALQEYGMDLKAETEQVFGAPPLIYKTAVQGRYTGAINFWHYLARMTVEGMKPLVSVQEAASALGLDPETPLLGYYFKESLLAEHPEIAQAFYNASREAKEILQTDATAWETIRPAMRAASDAEFTQLKSDWLAGVPARGPVDTNKAAKMLTLMGKLGGKELVGDATSLPPGIFADIE